MRIYLSRSFRVSLSESLLKVKFMTGRVILAPYENTIFRRHKNRQRGSTPELIARLRKASDSDGRRQSIYEMKREILSVPWATVGGGEGGLGSVTGARRFERKKRIRATIAGDKGVLGMNSRRAGFSMPFPALEL